MCRNANLGKRRLAFLEETAERENTSLYEALVRHLDEPTFKGTKAHDFVALIEQFAADYDGRPVSEVLATLLDASGYERCCALKAPGTSRQSRRAQAVDLSF